MLRYTLTAAALAAALLGASASAKAAGAPISDSDYVAKISTAAPPAVVAPFEYTALLWGILIDWTVWNVLPASRVFVGGAIVIAGGLYLVWHERSQQIAFDKSCAATPLP